MTTTAPETILTSDQQKALDACFEFLTDPNETVFVLKGYSGCGKSTLIRTFLDRRPAVMKTLRLINPSQKIHEVRLTATTNKAAENLAQITGESVTTIHSALGLRVVTDYRTNESKLVPRTKQLLEDTLLIVDEASYIDSDLLRQIFERTKNCKVLFVGDPAQLAPVKMNHTPVFDAKFKGAALTEVVRQAKGNPIVELSSMFRHTVNTGEWGSFTPDGNHVQHLSRPDFMAAIEKEFTRPDWRYQDSKILGWTNKCVIGYNHHINSLLTGAATFQVGDYAVCNSFINHNKQTIKTDQMVRITAMDPSTQFGVSGTTFQIDNSERFFMPTLLEDKAKVLRKAKQDEDYHRIQLIDTTWIDLRAAFACTINKAQGSTHDMVYIDLDDIKRCNSGDQIARMLYVGVSRARNKVYLTGDLAG